MENAFTTGIQDLEVNGGTTLEEFPKVASGIGDLKMTDLIGQGVGEKITILEFGVVAPDNEVRQWSASSTLENDPRDSKFERHSGSAPSFEVAAVGPRRWGGAWPSELNAMFAVECLSRRGPPPSNNIPAARYRLNCPFASRTTQWIGRSTPIVAIGLDPVGPWASRGDGLPASMNVKLLQDIVDMILYGGGFDREPPGNLFVGQPFVETRQDLMLAGCQVKHLPSRSIRKCGNPVDQHGRDPRRAAHFSIHNRLDRAQEVINRTVARDIAPDLSCRTGDDQVVLLGNIDGHQPDVGGDHSNLVRQAEILTGCDVKNDHIRP